MHHYIKASSLQMRPLNWQTKSLSRLRGLIRTLQSPVIDENAGGACSVVAKNEPFSSSSYAVAGDYNIALLVGLKLSGVMLLAASRRPPVSHAVLWARKLRRPQCLSADSSDLDLGT